MELVGYGDRLSDGVLGLELVNFGGIGVIRSWQVPSSFNGRGFLAFHGRTYWAVVVGAWENA